MSDSSLQTVQLHDFISRWQAGDAAAADHLFRCIGQRLENLARRMLRNYPNVRDFADTGDVFQGAVCRLLRTLRNLRPATTRDFFNLAAAHVRRELLDLARHHTGKPRPGAGPRVEEDSDLAPPAPDSLPPAELELWGRFHEAVGQLAAEEREVFNLTFYHGWTQPQIAELFCVAERTVRRRWRDACIQLAHLVGGQLPKI
ncbi:MAG: sigma-70 family RNA polymerase sigma factor [Gemmataceae bacterium]